MTKSSDSLLKHFSLIPDFRVEGRTDHKLFDILFIAVTASIAHCDDWQMVTLWAKEREPWLRRYCELPAGIPSHDTFSRVLARIAPDALHTAFMGWMEEIQEITAGDVVAIDGKTLRRSFARSGAGKGAIHMVSAWLSRNRVVLGQLKVEDYGDSCIVAPSGAERRAGHHRRHGVPEGNRRLRNRAGSRLRAGGERQPADLGRRRQAGF